LVETVQPKSLLPSLFQEGLITDVKLRELMKEAKSGTDVDCNSSIIWALSDSQLRQYCKVLLDSEGANREVGVKLRKALAEYGCKPELLPPLPDVPDTTMLESAVSNFYVSEMESPERQAIQRQLSSPGKPKTALNGSLTASPQSETSVVTVKVTNLSKSVTKQDLKGRLQYSTECSFKPKDISSVCLKVADVRSPNHAFVVCSSRAVAERVVTFLHDREIKGNKVTAKVHEPQNGKAATFPEVIKVHQIPKGMSADRLLTIIGSDCCNHVQVHLRASPGEHDYAWVNCADKETAVKVIGKLNGREVEVRSPGGHSRTKYTLLAQLHYKIENSLKVNNLPKNITQDQLKGVLLETDPLVNVRIFQVAGQPANYCYVNCSSDNTAAQVFEKLNRLVIDDRRLSVKFQQSKGSHMHHGQGHRVSRGTFSLKVVGLHESVTETDFVRLGSSQRGFTSAKFIPSSPHAHGFLVFDSRENAAAALENLTKLGYKASFA
jgi:RNA recognition motif-containing protein